MTRIGENCASKGWKLGIVGVEIVRALSKRVEIVGVLSVGVWIVGVGEVLFFFFDNER